MSEAVFAAIANAATGYVEAPAGCGKTEAIVRTVAGHCHGTQLILTHTHAGVDALRRRFRTHNVPTGKYHVDTIAGWAWGWVRRYPQNGQYAGSTKIAVWNDVYGAMANLLQMEFVRRGVLNSYAGIIVDEYQDCTVSMHRLISCLKTMLPCRVLGDDLQGIFGFREDALIGWDDVKTEFQTSLGILDTPHRWIKAEAGELGQWLLGTRDAFRAAQEPVYDGSPISRRRCRFVDVGTELLRLTNQKQGRICVIGPKMRRLPVSIETQLVKRGYHVLEANDLSALCSLVQALADGTAPQKSKAAIDFFEGAYGGLTEEKDFIAKILRGQSQGSKRPDRKALSLRHTQGTTLALVADLIGYVEKLSSPSKKLRESVSALKCILEKGPIGEEGLKEHYAAETARRRYASRTNIPLSIGSTLLVKGLEYEHAIIVRDDRWLQSWGSHRDLYVALTRGTKTATLVEVTR